MNTKNVKLKMVSLAIALAFVLSGAIALPKNIMANSLDAKQVSRSITQLRFPASSLPIQKGKSFAFDVKVSPASADERVVWKSSNANVVSVSQSGVVYAKKAGKATITAVSASGAQKAACVFSVQTKAVKATKLNVSKKSATLYVGQSLEINADVTPSTATVTYSSSNKAIASVSAGGKITAKKPGKAVITVKAGSIVRKINVTVKSPIVVKSVSLVNPVTQMTEGKTQTFKAQVLPANATFKTIAWSSSKPDVLSINANGKATALKPGKATITAKTSNGKLARVVVTVVQAPTPTPTEKPSASPSPTVTPTEAPTETPTPTPTTDTGGGGGGQTSQPTASPSGSPTPTATPTPAPTPVYRALLIGNQYMSSGSPLYGTFNDIVTMETLLGSTANGLSHNLSFNSIVSVQDATTAQIQSSIASTFAGAGENDVSYFYYAGHGARLGGVSYICATDGNIDVGVLAGWLNAIPGKIVVIMDSCYSGGFITRGASSIDDAETMNQGIIEAFKPQIQLMARGAVTDTADKFYVLTACSATRVSYSAWDSGTEQLNSYGIFTYILNQGASGSPYKNADTNQNNVITLEEAYQYINIHRNDQKWVNKGGLGANNDVQRYPENNDFPLFSF